MLGVYLFMDFTIITHCVLLWCPTMPEKYVGSMIVWHRPSSQSPINIWYFITDSNWVSACQNAFDWKIKMHHSMAE